MDVTAVYSRPLRVVKFRQVSRLVGLSKNFKRQRDTSHAFLPTTSTTCLPLLLPPAPCTTFITATKAAGAQVSHSILIIYCSNILCADISICLCTPWLWLIPLTASLITSICRTPLHISITPRTTIISPCTCPCPCPPSITLGPLWGCFCFW